MLIKSVLKGGPWDGRTVHHRAGVPDLAIHDPINPSDIKDGSRMEHPPYHIYELYEDSYTYRHTTKPVYRKSV